MSNEIKNDKEFFLVLNGNTSDTTNVSWDGNEGFPSKEAAIEHAKDVAYDGSAFTLFRCIPIEVIERGPVRVRTVTAKKP